MRRPNTSQLSSAPQTGIKRNETRSPTTTRSALIRLHPAAALAVTIGVGFERLSPAAWEFTANEQSEYTDFRDAQNYACAVNSVFVIPRGLVKNGLDRYVVLNHVARSVIASCRGQHPERVFTRNGRPLTKIYNSGWTGARERAADRYAAELGRPAPLGFRRLRVHDLKHTFGHRLRVAGIGFEDRKFLLGHKSEHVTTHYSAPEISTLIAAAEKVCELGSRKSHALSIVRPQAKLASH